VTSILEIRHQFIAELFEAFEDDRSRYLVFEWAENGTLSEWLERKGPFPESQARLYFSQIIFALQHLHRERTAPHGALISDHVVLDRHNNVRLIDFGLRSQILYHGQYNPDCLPLPWAAPELLKGHPCSRASDIWAVGMLLWGMLSGKPPSFDSADSFLSAEFVFPITFTPHLIDLLKKMLQKSPEARITLDWIIKHPWFSHTQYSTVLEARFSQQRVTEAGIDKEVMRRMAGLRMDISALPQQLIDREVTPLTAVYRQFVRGKSMDALADLMDRSAPSRPQAPAGFKFQFPGASRKGAAGGAVRGGTPEAGSPGRAAGRDPSPGAVRTGPRTLAQAVPLQIAERRRSKPAAVQTLMPTHPLRSGRFALDH
jgi:serine/threonine protein kinase